MPSGVLGYRYPIEVMKEKIAQQHSFSELHTREKRKREYSILKSFLKYFNKEKQSNFELKDRREQPDFEIIDQSTGKVLGIEVTDLFYDDDDAKILLGRTNETISNSQYSDALMEKLSCRIKSKEKRAKNYLYTGHLLLIIRIASPIWGKSTFEMFRSDLSISTEIYREIWLVFLNDSEGECMKLI